MLAATLSHVVAVLVYLCEVRTGEHRGRVRCCLRVRAGIAV